MKIVQSVPSLCHNKIKSRQINICQLKIVSRETFRIGRYRSVAQKILTASINRRRQYFFALEGLLGY